MPIKLSLRPSIHSRPGPDFADPKKRVIQHQVQGLPPGRKALIGQSNHKWKILRTKDGVSGDWEGEYDTAEEALAALRQELDNEES
jgi:hypothetical protein